MLPARPRFPFCIALILSLAACAGHRTGADSRRSPRLQAEPLAGVKRSLTYGGDWVGGAPGAGAAEASINLARRRGVEMLVDLRRPTEPEDGVAALARAAGLSFHAVDPTGDECAAGEEPGGVEDHGVLLAGGALAEVRRLLNTPGRPKVLMIDDDGTLAAVMFGVYLARDVGLDEGEVIRALRGTGLSEDELSRLLRASGGPADRAPRSD
ncbi:MAG: hypothetical protein ACPGPE_00330 [Planctomycetota bacterium]